MNQRCMRCIVLITREKRMIFSEKQIEFILERADAAYRHNHCSESRKENFLLSVKSYLETDSCGMMQDVCHRCLGTGYKKKKR